MPVETGTDLYQIGSGLSRKARVANALRAGFDFSLRHRIEREGTPSWLYPSMSEFADNANRGLVAATIAEHLNGSVPVDPSRFYLTAVQDNSWPRADIRFPSQHDMPGICYLDSPKGFALSYRTSQPGRDDVHLAVTSVGPIYAMGGVDVILNQNQAVENYGRQQELQQEILRGMKWEYAQALLAIYWAKAAGVNRFWMTKAASLVWTRVGALSMDRAKLRYDVVAQRLGFENKEHSFILPLNPATKA